MTWVESAACRGMDVEIFFHSDNERGRNRRARSTRAKAVCADCQVTSECLTAAEGRREAHGIWGGLTPEERGYTNAGYAPRTVQV